MAEVELPSPDELREMKEKAFTRNVAMVTAFFAVLLAITSLGGNNAMKEMILAQQQSSDQWAFYQAKVIREHLYRSEKIRMETELAMYSDTLAEPAREKLNSVIKMFGEEEKRYNSEKKEIERDARKLEEERDVNRSKDPYFDYAEVLLQIAIVMASVSILAGSSGVFCFAAVAAVLGAILSANGFLLIFKIPFLH
ncbi:MAG: DUF4337 domain-containing protein [Syntrophobacteraceae bacterium]